MAKSNYPHKQRSGGSNRGALIALLVLLIIAAAVFLLRSCTDGKTPDPAPGGIVYDPGAVEGEEDHGVRDAVERVPHVHRVEVVRPLQLLRPPDRLDLRQVLEGQLPGGQPAERGGLAQEQAVEGDQEGLLHRDGAPLAARLRQELQPELGKRPQRRPVLGREELGKGRGEDLCRPGVRAQVQQVGLRQPRRARRDGLHRPQLLLEPLRRHLGGGAEGVRGRREGDGQGGRVELAHDARPLLAPRLGQPVRRVRLAQEGLPRAAQMPPT